MNLSSYYGFCKGFVDRDSFFPSIFILAAGLSFTMAVQPCSLGRRLQARRPELSHSHRQVGQRIGGFEGQGRGWKGQSTRKGARRTAPRDPFGCAGPGGSKRILQALSVPDLLPTQSPLPTLSCGFTLARYTHAQAVQVPLEEKKQGWTLFFFARGLNTQMMS